MSSPQDAYPVVHVAGTNGKSTTTRLAAAIIGAHGLTVGAFTSPALLEPEEHFEVGGEQMRPEQLGPAVADVAPFVDITGGDATEFEVLTAAAFSWFVERSVDVAVVEAGLGGAHDATNVVGAPVAVITSVGHDHADALGATLSAVASAKAGIVHAGATLVTGPLPAEADGPVAARVAETGAVWRRLGDDFDLASLTQAVGGWVADVDGVYEHYEEVFMPLHGRHQATNLAMAVVAAEELLGRALDPEAVRAGVAATRVPGRLEVISSGPVVLLDVAHNPSGFAALSAALAEEFLPTEWVLVFGARGARDPQAMLRPLRGNVAALVATAAVDPAAHAVAEVAAAGAAALPGVPVEAAASVPEAVARALALAPPEGGVLVAGSHGVVGEARAVLTRPPG